jgi:hypothetical protein
LPRKLAGYLIGHQCRTVVECGRSGIALLIVRARSNRIQDLVPVIPECLAALASIQPRQVVRAGSFQAVDDQL